MAKSAPVSSTRTVRSALGRLVVALWLPLALAALVLVVQRWQAERDAALARLQSEAQVLRVAVDRELSLDLAVLQTLASSTAVEHDDWPALHAAAVRTAAIRPASVVTAFAPDGRNIINSSVRFGDPLPNVFQRPAEQTAMWQGRAVPLPPLSLFAEPFRTGRPAFSGLVWGRLSRRPVVATHLPAVRNGEVVLVVGLSYGADVYARVLESTPRQPGSVRALVDGRGLIIARQPGNETFTARRAVGAFAQGGAQLAASGAGRGHSLDGVDVLFAHSRSVVNDWTVVVATPRDQVLAPAWYTLWTSLAWLAVAAGLGAVLARQLARKLASPLRALAEQVHPQSAMGPFDTGPSGIVEVDMLAGALAEAARAQQLRAGLERDREQARDELHRTNDELIQANRQKDEFIAVLSHELRNPLAPIRNSLYILDRSDPAGPAALRARKVIERQVKHMTALVDDLLDATRMARGRLQLTLAPVDMAGLLRRVQQDHRELLAERGLTLEIEAPERPVWVHGDATRLAQVIGNLIDNAAKFTPSGGGVRLRLSVHGGDVAVDVVDDGAGIDRAQLAAIFEPFFQGDQGLARTAGGLGLGLAIVRGIVGLHGGRVEAFSEGIGRGSRFVVHLPEAAPPPVDDASPERRQAPRQPAGRRNVLVVEDQPDVAHSLMEMIRLLGHEVYWAGDAATALALHRQHAPDTVLCDIGLPGASGYDVASALRRDATRARLIALSGYARPEDVQRAIDAGFDDHIAKPADPERIVTLLGQAQDAA